MKQKCGFCEKIFEYNFWDAIGQVNLIPIPSNTHGTILCDDCLSIYYKIQRKEEKELIEWWKKKNGRYKQETKRKSKTR